MSYQHNLRKEPNYIVIYRVMPEQVEILRVKHVAQRWP
jgi:plasmid stabilization system protein ParE